ncbi:MAG: hypothetical protein KBD78_05725 [Oligoflexales bacterium]|nr:hypothetical protein [Oligoflexales bacterium]
MKTILAIETSLGGLSLGLLQVNSDASVQILELEQQSANQAAAEMLPIEVIKILGRRNLQAVDIDHYVVSIGPGSMTGIRIALAFLQGVFAANPLTKFYGVSALDMILLGSKRPQNSILLLPSTKTHGFVRNLDESNFLGNSSMSYRQVAEISQQISKNGKKDRVIVLEQGTSFVASELKSLGIEIELWDKKDAFQYWLDGVSQICSTKVAKFVCAVPVANYARASTADERRI